VSGLRIRAWKTGSARPAVAAASPTASSNAPAWAKRVGDGSTSSPVGTAFRGSEKECIVAPSADSACRARSRSQAPSFAEPSMSEMETSPADRTVTIVASPAAWLGKGRIPVRTRRTADRPADRSLIISGTVVAVRAG
jgi:hypothetical protein